MPIGAGVEEDAWDTACKPEQGAQDLATGEDS